MYHGLMINSHYIIHETLLRDNKDVFFDLINLDDIYFDENFTTSNEIYNIAREILQYSLPTDKINNKDFTKLESSGSLDFQNDRTENKVLNTVDFIVEEKSSTIITIPSERNIKLSTSNDSISKTALNSQFINSFTDKKMNKTYSKKDRKFQKRRKQYLKELISISDHIIQKLEYARTYSPFKVFGIPMTKEIFNSLLASLGAVLIASLQKLIFQ